MKCEVLLRVALASAGLAAVLGCPPIQPDEPLEVRIQASATEGKAPLAVSLSLWWSGSSEPSVASVTWNFGDGSYSRSIPVDAAAPMGYTFTNSGVYAVRATAFMATGEVVSDTIQITVSAGKPPTARITGPLGERIAMWASPLSFDGSASADPDGSILEYKWQFGDGTAATGRAVEHTYRGSGAFTVRLTVADDNGNTDSAEKTVQIAKPQVRMLVGVAGLDGQVTIELDPTRAPISVENFLQYVDDGFYDGRDGQGATIIHRVEAWTSQIPLVQGGGMTIDRELKETRDPIKNESGNGLSNKRGTIAMARTQEWDSATSQFYVNVGDNTGFDGQYAVFGKIVGGMEIIDGMLDLPLEGTSPNIGPIDPPVIKLAERYKP